MIAVGGTEKMHRTVLSCVLRGHGPGDAAAEVSMKRMLKSVEAVLDASVLGLDYVRFAFVSRVVVPFGAFSRVGVLWIVF